MPPSISMIFSLSAVKLDIVGSHLPLISIFLKGFSISVADVQSCLHFNHEESVIQKIERSSFDCSGLLICRYVHPNICAELMISVNMETVILPCLYILYSRDGSSILHGT